MHVIMRVIRLSDCAVVTPGMRCTFRVAGLCPGAGRSKPSRPCTLTLCADARDARDEQVLRGPLLHAAEAPALGRLLAVPQVLAHPGSHLWGSQGQIGSQAHQAQPSGRVGATWLTVDLRGGEPHVDDTARSDDKTQHLSRSSASPATPTCLSLPSQGYGLICMAL